MSVEEADVIDGIGIDPDGSTILLLISDHLPWGDPRHLELLAAKVEAYAEVVLSGRLPAIYPQAAGKSVRIRCIRQHAPDDAAVRFLEEVRGQLKAVSIDFEATALPDGY